jgi:hypothetical protein
MSHFDTSSAVHFRSASLYLPDDAYSATFYLNAQHHTFWAQHLQVVCKLCLHSVCGRPTTIFYLALKRTIHEFFYSWHTRTLASPGHRKSLVSVELQGFLVLVCVSFICFSALYHCLTHRMTRSFFRTIFTTTTVVKCTSPGAVFYSTHREVFTNFLVVDLTQLLPLLSTKESFDFSKTKYNR